LRLMRVVLGPAAIRVILGFKTLPAGASDKWRRAGYSAVDLVLRLGSPTVEHLDAAGLLSEQDGVTVELDRNRIVIKSGDQPMLVASIEYVDAQFLPDPVMQRLEASRDESGSELEPSPFVRDPEQQ